MAHQIVYHGGTVPEVSTLVSFLPTDGIGVTLFANASTYANLGYGSFTLCSPSCALPYCDRIRSDFAIVDSAQGTPSSNDLLAEWLHIRSSRLRMRHQQGPLFDIYFTTLHPEGYGKDTTLFETGGIGTTKGLAEFVVQDGEAVGLSGRTIDGAGTQGHDG
ncbi:hypothetical protein JVU11DRAFT_8288 [Chiua virens]|nr:hypothetical protein JVU11DRAFT_8288 [Chiua virens]